MTEEKKPLPTLALTAIRLVSSEYERNVQTIAAQILDGMNLSAAEGWQVNFAEGVAVRAVADNESPVPTGENTKTNTGGTRG